MKQSTKEETMQRLLTATVMGGIVLTGMWLAPMAIAVQGDAAKGKEVFVKACASCHGGTGKGNGPAAAALDPKPGDLTNQEYMKGLKDDYMREIIAKGGKAVGKSPLMPPLGATLKPDDVDNVIVFLRSLSS
jgi:mono/diheme cytochrome c family protein